MSPTGLGQPRKGRRSIPKPSRATPRSRPPGRGSWWRAGDGGRARRRRGVSAPSRSRGRRPGPSPTRAPRARSSRAAGWHARGLTPEELGQCLERLVPVLAARLDVRVLAELVPADDADGIGLRVAGGRELGPQRLAPETVDDRGASRGGWRRSPTAAGAIQRPPSAWTSAAMAFELVLVARERGRVDRRPVVGVAVDEAAEPLRRRSASSPSRGAGSCRAGLRPATRCRRGSTPTSRTGSPSVWRRAGTPVAEAKREMKRSRSDAMVAVGVGFRLKSRPS